MILPSFDHTIKWRAKHFRVMEETTLDTTILNTPVKMICTTEMVVALKVRFFKAFMAFFQTFSDAIKKRIFYPVKIPNHLSPIRQNSIVIFFLSKLKLLNR